MDKLVLYRKSIVPKIQSEVNKLARQWIKDLYRVIPPSRRLLPAFSLCKKTGQCMRGSLAVLSYESYGGKINKKIIRIAGIIELLQTALLIHDDIMDGSKTRRGDKSFHEKVNTQLKKKFYANKKDKAIGISLAIGDHLIMWLQNEINKISKDLNKYFTEYVLQTMHGQISDATLDIIPKDKKKIKRIYINKTGAYTFRLPIILGCALSSKKINVLEKKNLELLSGNLGIMMQSRDDLSGFSNSKNAMVNLKEDITNKQPALWVPILLNCVTPKEKIILNRIWNANKINLSDLNYIKKIFYRHQVEKIISKETRLEAKNSYKIVSTLSIKKHKVAIWNALIYFAENIYKG